ncbi:ENTH domain protein [compost metagenome]
MPLVWKRIGESNEYWRIIYKTLVLLRELVRFGSARVVDETRDHMYNLRSLEGFRFSEDGCAQAHTA